MTPLSLSPTLPAGHTHPDRLAVAHRLAALILEAHGDTISAVGLYGTTALGQDGPYSDLDMTVVTHSGLGAHSRCYTHEGLLINLDYQTVAESEEEARDPAQAGNWRDFQALYDPAGLVDHLRRLAASLTEQDYLRAFHGYMCDDLPANVGKIRNAALAGDRASLIHALASFGVAACRALCLLNGRSVTGQARLRPNTKTLPLLPPDFPRLSDLVSGAVAAPEQTMYDAAETLWAGLRRLAVTRGLPLETPALEP